MSKIEHLCRELKGIIEIYETSSFITELSLMTYAIGKRNEYEIFEHLTSPMYQLFYLAGLNICSKYNGEKKKFSYRKEEWNRIGKLLSKIELEYFNSIGFPHNGKESKEVLEKVRISLPTFLTYFLHTSLSYEEQQIEKIERIFVGFDKEIKEKFKLSIADLISLNNVVDNLLHKKINTIPKLYYSENWQKFTKSMIDKGIEDPKDWIKFGGEELQDAMNYLVNFSHNFTLNISLVKKTKQDNILNFLDCLGCKEQEESSLLFYTDRNILFDKPIFRTNKEEFIVFNQKHLIDGIFLNVFNYLENNKATRNRLYKARDRFIEVKTFELFRDFFGKKAKIYTNYCLEHNAEQDIIVFFGKNILVIEVKAGKSREPLRDPVKAYDRIKRDFRKTIQPAFEQAKRAEDFIYRNRNLKLKTLKGDIIENIKMAKSPNVFSILVTFERYGQIQTDLSLLLDIDDERPYPWSVCVEDLETILLALKHKKNYRKNFIKYLSLRERLHEHMLSDDEIEIFGSFFQNPNHFTKLSNAKETIAFQPKDTKPIEKLFFSGLGFKNERRLDKKQNRHTVRLFR